MPRPIPYTPHQVRYQTVHSAVTADVAAADAMKVLVAGAKALMIALTNASINNRTWTVTVEVSIDGGTTFATYNMLVTNQADTNAEDAVHSASLARATNGTSIAFFEPDTLGAITHVRFPITKTDGGSPAGNATVVVAAQF